MSHILIIGMHLSEMIISRVSILVKEVGVGLGEIVYHCWVELIGLQPNELLAPIDDSHPS